MSQHPPSACYSQILMSNHARPLHLQRSRVLAILLPLAALLMIATACGGTINPTQNGTGALAANQVLILPNVGTQDIGVLDPALGVAAIIPSWVHGVSLNGEGRSSSAIGQMSTCCNIRIYHAPYLLRLWQGELVSLQTLDEGRTAQVRPDPGSKTLLECLALFELLGGSTQLDQ